MNSMTRYSCEETFRRLDDFLDRELSSDEARLVQEHLKSCELCASEFAFEARVLGEVREKLRRMEIPRDVRERLLQRLSAVDGV